jgi:hypothetical protein
VAVQYTNPYCEWLPLSPVPLVCGTAVDNVFPFWALSSLYFF